MTRDDPELGPWRISAKVLIVCSVLTTLGFSLVCGSVLLDMRHGEEALARQTMENLASTIDSDISRNIEIYDLSLRNVAMNMIEPEIAGISKPILQLILFDHAATAKHYGTIQVFDASGNLTLDSASLNPAKENRADEDYFKIHRDNPDTGLFISKPDLYRGNYSVVLSRRITHDGKFLGVVVGSLHFSYFHDLFGGLTLNPDDAITVFRHDGVVIMRMPFDIDVIGKDLSAVPGVRQSLSVASGAESRPSAVDSIQRLYVWRNNSRPLVVVVGKSWDSIYSLWHRQAAKIGSIMLALILFVAATTLFLAREIKRRARAEGRLEELASTDALTSLKNRRQFDHVIAREWRRARQSEPLALLMIDADFFKTFNDMFGHQAGDQVLVRIAVCIDDAVQRSGDCAARYGGEEFAVLLCGLSTDAALVVAEAIRSQVEVLSVEKWATTVSIGVASVIPTASLQPSDLVAAADRALYEAKGLGRNRCVVADMDALLRVA